MAAKRNMRHEPDQKHYVIDPSNPWHLTWWANKLGVSEDALVEAILRVGVDADAVEAFLTGRDPDAQSH